MHQLWLFKDWQLRNNMPVTFWTPFWIPALRRQSGCKQEGNRRQSGKEREPLEVQRASSSSSAEGEREGCCKKAAEVRSRVRARHLHATPETSGGSHSVWAPGSSALKHKWQSTYFQVLKFKYNTIYGKLRCFLIKVPASIQYTIWLPRCFFGLKALASI